MTHTPTGIPEFELDALWDEFHQAVNMTSQELAAWLLTSAAHEATGELPEHAGPDTGRHVLAILRKRRTDLTARDVDVMYAVVDTVTEQRRTDLPPAGKQAWRHRLMSVGHDPLKPS